MSTERRINSSRANGAKSRGPVTARGKRISARNATRHGRFAEAVVLNGESLRSFRRLLNQLREQYSPANAVEDILVENMAVARWRQIRLWAIEKAGFDYQIDRQNEPVDSSTRAALAFRSLSDGSRSLDLLIRYETRYDRQFARALARLLAMRTNPGSSLEKI